MPKLEVAAMPAEDFAERVSAQCQRCLATEAPGGTRTRQIVISPELGELLLWHVVVAGVVHVGCGIVAHALWDKLRRAESALRGLRAGEDAPAVAAARAAVAQAQEAVGEVGPLLPELKDRPADTAGAKAAVAETLRSAGWGETAAARAADRITQTVAATMGVKPSDGA